MHREDTYHCPLRYYPQWTRSDKFGSIYLMPEFPSSFSRLTLVVEHHQVVSVQLAELFPLLLAQLGQIFLIVAVLGDVEVLGDVGE